MSLTLIAAPAHALREHHRLGRDVVPTSQTLKLDVDAGRPTFSGSTRIALQVRAATDSFELYAQRMTIKTLSLRNVRGTIPVTWHVEPEHGLLTVHTNTPLRPGPLTLDIAYTDTFDTRADALYRLETGGHAYTFSQFEAIAARRAFPCWDEPEFKIPWQLTVTVPRSHVAISNTPVIRDTVIGARRRVAFERTPPMPSYLLALATGPLDRLPIRGMGVPGSIVSVSGKKHLGKDAATMAPPILKALERYFGRPYPYRKLDLLAVPEFAAGAMENAGAITFREPYLMLDPATMSGRDRRTLITVNAHEMAHMWFGDLVTMEWWDDVWLNESFASWLGDKISQQVAPEFNLPLEELSGTQRAMNVDARPSTHAMRQPVDAFDNLDDLFDFLAYQKGQSVLGMLERWLGEDVFQAGVRDYIKTHEWKNARGEDLWNALSKASGRDASGVAASFLDQPGVPLVTLSLEGGTVRLRQSRFHNFGAEVSPAQWHIPVTLKWSDGRNATTRTVVLTDPEQTVTLPGRIAWVHPNAHESGYYRWSVPPAMLTTLADSAQKALDSRERLGYVNNLSALLDAGLVNGDEFLRLLAHFGDDPEPQVVSATLVGLDHAHAAFVTSANSAAFAAYVRRTFGPAYARVGPTRADGESETTTLLRTDLMRRLGEYGSDAIVLQSARALADRYLADPASVDASLASTALELTAQQGDTALFNAYRRRFEGSTLPGDRTRLLGGLGSFREPAVLARALDYSLRGPLRPQEISDIIDDFVGPEETREQVFEWTLRHHPEIVARIPPFKLTALVRASGGCSAQRLEAGRKFFLDPSRHMAGIEQEFAKVSDATKDCLSLREREGARVDAFLSGLAQAN